jgi:hypothetical protein
MKTRTGRLVDHFAFSPAADAATAGDHSLIAIDGVASDKGAGIIAGGSQGS